MTHVLLLGAGFSRNWNGWLADEVMGDMLLRLVGDAELHPLLSQSPNFEDALSRVQEDFQNSLTATNKGRVERMQAAVMATFRAMNESFAARPGIQFSKYRRFSIVDYLARFDAIFTLNQDLLLELHYGHLELAEPRRWNGHYFPGLVVPPGWHSAIGAFLPDRLGMVWHPAADFRLEKRLQPIYKLHGSVNWKAGDEDMLVLGGNKAGAIAETKLLKWYSDEFRRYLEMPDTRLMVIGCSFNDLHIQQLLHDSWRKSGFRMFIVDLQGRKLLDQKTARGFKLLNPLEDIPLLGDSVRPLSTTFGGDDLEHGKFLRFFGAA